MIWIIISIVLGWLFMGHCFYMFAKWVAEENGNNDSSIWGWIICLFLWPLIILVVGVVHSFVKVLS